MNKWVNAQSHEAHFWGTCTQTFVEEQKQFFYATRMKLPFVDYPLSSIDFHGKSVIDVGAGPTSILLKSKNYSKAVAVDPLMDIFPKWVIDRYNSVGIETISQGGEDIDTTQRFDIALLYNVLQHTIDPEIIAHKLLRIAKQVHVFEWIDVASDDLHPHILTEENLNKWFQTKGMVERVHEPYMFDADCWYTVAKGIE
jgi:2-polyprenyl-3-methyl-5-hydroxy-6-metoxy-1,4-benzoquinol methylase